MISHPQRGQIVQLWYRESLRTVAPHHGRFGIVTTPAKGRPRNHGVMLQDGTTTIVPSGNLRNPDKDMVAAIKEYMTLGDVE